MKYRITREDFLIPEIRDGEHIGVEKKRVMKCMLDMLEVLIGICEKHNLRYFVAAGTLLGAVRHQGFIPWDDDLDIMMPREDYNKIQTILPRELPAYLFMQTTITDPHFQYPLVKIRDVRTSAIDVRYLQNNLRFNMGIFIDVFPVDGVPDNPNQLKSQQRLVGRLMPFMRSRELRGAVARKEKVRKFAYLALWTLFGRRVIVRLRESIASRFAIDKCRMCALDVLCFGYNSRFTWPSSFMQEGFVELPFEYLKVKVPKRYEDWLSYVYGDWRKFVRGASCHGHLVQDAKTPYQMKAAELGFKW